MIRKITNKKDHSRKEDGDGYLFILFALIVFVVFTIYPLITSIVTSFYNYKPVGVSAFVGLKNYFDTFHSKLFWKALRNTVIYTAFTVPISQIISFCIAIMILPFKKRTQTFFKSAFYIPSVVSGVALSVVWLWIYSSSPSGLANRILSFLGIQSQNWLSSKKTAMLSLILMTIFGGQGQSIIIYIAALLNIDNTYFEAAEIDSANFIQKVVYIVWPLCKPTTIFLLVTGVISSFQVFVNSYMMTGGGPDNNTTMVGLLIFNNAFKYGKYGLACAQAVLLAIVIAALTAILFKINGDEVEY